MSAELAFIQRVLNNPILRPPSQLFVDAIVPTGATTAATIGDSLRSAANNRATTNSTTLQNLVNVTGRGVLMFGAFYNGTNANNCECVVTIDGVTVLAATNSGINALRCFAGCVSELDIANVSSTVAFEAIPFLVSLQIQYRSTNAATTVGAAAKYRLHN